jgi:REP element-mobilizing transposase RayT
MGKKKVRRVREWQLTAPWTRVAHPGNKLGRKPSKDSGVSHGSRPRLAASTPIHITLKWCAGLPTLRDAGPDAIIRASFRHTNEDNENGLRIVMYSIQGNHLHMICEADGAKSLGRAMQGLKVRIARRLNRLWERTGTVFADRYHRQDLTSPTQVHGCIRYVLQNRFRHRLTASCSNPNHPDRYSSGRWFTGWSEPHLQVTPDDLLDAPVQEPGTWLLSKGWKDKGLLSITDRPS